MYLVGHDVPPDRAPLFAAALALGPETCISHRSALEDYRVVRPVPGPVHVTVPGRCRRSRKGIRVHRTTRIAPEDLGSRDGLPITSPARSILDFADTASQRELERAVNEAHVLRLVTMQDLYDVLARTPGRRGARKLRTILDRYAGPVKIHRGGEELLDRALKAACITGYRVNAVVHGREVDFYFEDAGIVIEADSATYHGVPGAVHRDRSKEAFLRRRGLEVLRFSYEQVRDEITAVIADIATELARGRRA